MFAREESQYGLAYSEAFDEFKAALNEGRIRAAEPDPSSPTGWKVNAWVKKGILLGFRIGRIVEMPLKFKIVRTIGTGRPAVTESEHQTQFRDKHTYPLKKIPPERNVRVVPGGSSIRDGCYIGKGVVCMPPMYVNVGSYVDDGALIDSHALVGSCAQIGKRVHLSAGAQIGGVLEPVGALPVVLEDEVLVGGNCGVYEGTVVKRRAVLGTGTILNRSIPVYDLIRDAVYTATDSDPLVIPEQAIVVPGSRAVSHAAGAKWGLSLQAAVIVKYRDAKTDARVQLEDLLR